jgi:hypothetical protein
MNSSKLKGFLTGLILGDGYIDKGVTKRAFSIKSINFDFIDYIHESLLDTTNFNIEVKQFAGSIRGGVMRKPYKELRVKAHPYFNKKYNYFYDDYRNRRITKECLGWLSPEGLANWYMSDGYIVLVGRNSGAIKDRRVEIATDRYSQSDVSKVVRYFNEQFGYKIHMVERKKGVYRLRISLLDAQKFFLMIEPFIVPSMRYKINLNYIEQPRWMCDEYYHLMKRLQSAETLTYKVEG